MRNLADLADQARSRGVSVGPRGLDFARAAIALAKAGGIAGAADYAEARWGSGSRAAEVTKAAVDAMATGSSNLVAADTEFFAAVGERSIPGRLAGLHRMPLNVRTLTGTGAVASWVGEGRLKPITSMSFAAQTLPGAKVLAVAVVTEELLNQSDPAAENVIRADLSRAYGAALDTAFIDPSNGGLVDDGVVITPASITNGVTPVTGTANPVADLRNLVDDFEGDLDAAYLVMPPLLAVGMSGATFPNVGARGGNVSGIPVVTSRHVPAGVIALVDPSGIGYGEGAGELRTIREGDVFMEGETIGSPPEPAVLVSLWQQNCAALVVGRSVNWARVRPGSVALVTGANYGAAA